MTLHPFIALLAMAAAALGAPASAEPAGEASADTAAPVTAAASRPGRSLADVTIAYERMLSRAKNPPSRLKALLNDIGNRTANFGYTTEAILEELKRSGRLTIDEKGRVSRA